MLINKHTKVFTVLSFLKLKSPDISWYQWWYPSIIYISSYLLFHFLGKDIIVFESDKLIQAITNMMGILFGFYIASLAAVSSFTNATLDQKMKGRAPTITSIRKKEEVTETLTRRRFLTILFGYCAILSITIYMVGALQLHSSIGKIDVEWIAWVIKAGTETIKFIYGWMLSSLFVVTLLGLHYLVERMHRA